MHVQSAAGTGPSPAHATCMPVKSHDGGRTGHRLQFQPAGAVLGMHVIPCSANQAAPAPMAVARSQSLLEVAAEAPTSRCLLGAGRAVCSRQTGATHRIAALLQLQSLHHGHLPP